MFRILIKSAKVPTKDRNDKQGVFRKVLKHDTRRDGGFSDVALFHFDNKSPKVDTRDLV